MNTFYNKNIIILGLAKTGYSTALLMSEFGANVTVSALKQDITNEQMNILINKGIKIIWGPHPMELLNNEVHLVIKNPGIPYSIPFIIKALEKGIEVLSEVEIVSDLLTDTIAITGSNGKTTTTSLIHNILGKAKETIVCGNIGRPFSDVVLKNEHHKTLVCELSSFQLKGSKTFRPSIAILLNIDAAHLDYHGTIDDYINSKAAITMNQKQSDYFIFNQDDVVVSEIANQTNASTIPFSTTSYLKFGACVFNNWIYYNGQKFMETNKLSLPGKHNQENILSALIAAKLHDVPDNLIIESLQTFSGVEHRLQYVKSINNRMFFNDSKATNIKASTNAVNAFETQPILIAGGLDRGNDFDEFVPSLKKCKHVFVYGETADKILNTAKKYHLENVSKVSTLHEATVCSFTFSDENDVILLSPACASWDQFSSFEERGNQFIQYINELDTKELTNNNDVLTTVSN